MKKTCTSALVLILAVAVSGAASAQEAKGNAPVKQRHTVNDGTSKRGANSFTESEARQHILHSGYSDVSGLTKGEDGVWRGTATRGGAQRPVELDFKGNVTDPTAASSAAGVSTADASVGRTDKAQPTGQAQMASGREHDASLAGSGATPAARASDTGSRLADRRAAEQSGAAAPRGADGRSGHQTRPAAVHAARKHHGNGARCAQPGPNGAACSGVDKNRNGVSDREDHAIARGAHP